MGSSHKLLDGSAIGVWATGRSRAMGEDQMGSSVRDIVVASVVKLSDQK